MPSEDQNPNLTIRERLSEETGVLDWHELERHFARGVVIRVDPEIDLIDVAIEFVNDDTDSIQHWLTSTLIARASDDDARDWTQRGPRFKCVVVAPWVLVQETDEPAQLH